MAISLVPTIATHYLVEARFHHSPRLASRPRLALQLGAACIAVSIVAGLLVSITAPTIRTASAAEVQGAKALMSDPTTIQRTARALRPNPRNADADQPAMYFDGCWQQRRGTLSPDCTYGPRDAPAKLLLFGDSHAAMWAPALHAIAQRRGWSFVFLAKQGCSPAMTPIWNGPLGRAYTECDAWRETTLRRIERDERPDLIVADGANGYAAMDGSTKLAGVDSGPTLQAGYAKTLARRKATGARVVTMANSPTAPGDIPSCVAGKLDHLDDCAFDRTTAYARPPINRQAAEAVGGIEVLDPAPVICPGARCPAVVGDVLVYRDDNHLTATYSRTLAPWLSAHLPKL
jgi:hypothetical protein